MKVLEETYPITLEPTENGIIVRVASARDPYSDMGNIATSYVFNEMSELHEFISRHFLGEMNNGPTIKGYEVRYEGEYVDPIYAIDGNPVYGGGS
jgi:hypothetical protein